RRAASGGVCASEGRPAAGPLHAGAGDERAARRRRDLPDAAAAPARRRRAADTTGPPAATHPHVMRRRPAVALAALALAACARGEAGPPDLILAGGRIFTADSARPWAEALAVRHDRIVAVGNTDSVRRLAGPRTGTLGIGHDTPDPPGGRYGRVPGSEVLDGRLTEYAWWNARRRLSSSVPDSASRADLLRYADAAARFGITTVQDMNNNLTTARAV